MLLKLRTCVGGLLLVGFVATPVVNAAPNLPSSPGAVESTLPTKGRLVLPKAAPADLVKPSQAVKPKVASGGRQILVERFELDGNSKLTAEQIAAVIDPYAGQQLTIEQIYSVADELGALYRAHGYRLATVTLPPQKISAGVIRLEVVEGRIETVEFSGNQTYSSEFLRQQVDQLEDGEVLSLEAMEREMMLLNDLPGLSARSVIKPGSVYGSSLIDIETTEQRVDGYLVGNNYGREDVGEWRLEGGVGVNNPLGIGDRFNFDFMHSQSDLLNFYAFGYSLPVNRHGTRFAVSYSQADFDVALDSGIKVLFSGEELSGTTRSTRLQLSHPLVRSRDRNILLGIGLLHKDGNTQDKASVGVPHTLDREETINLLDVSVVMSQTHADHSLSNVSAVFWTNFRKRQNDELAVDDAGAPAGGGDRNRVRGKLRLDVNHLRAFYAGWSLYLRAAGVLSVDPLPDSEKFGIGGPADVRGFPTSEVRGDQGYSGTAELRKQFKIIAGRDLLVRAFVDAGKVYRKDRLPLVLHSESLSSVGFGIAIAPFKKLQIDLNAAFPTNSRKASDGSNSSRFWANLSTRY